MKNSLELDPWSFLDFKQTMERDRRLAPTWVSDHWRRLQAYTLLDSYYRNSARGWLNSDVSDDLRKGRREYGDPHVIVEQVMASLLGDDFSIHVEGEEDGENEAAQAQISLLRDWAWKERFSSKVVESERQSVKLGDSVFVVGWSSTKERPVIRVYDPGMFFPVWRDDAIDDEFPDKIHIAYEFERTVGLNKKKKFVRRITWELLPYEEDEDGEQPMLEVPWRQGPSEVSCFYSDGVWEVSDDTRTVDDFREDKAEWRAENVDLMIDFIPVVHIPNHVAGQEFWGQSNLAVILQIFDDLATNDTDINAAAGTTGSPIIGVGGTNLPKDENGRVVGYGPGTVYELGENGRLDALDMSKSLDALLKNSAALLERLSVNGRIPESMLGRVKPSEVPSGIALWLSFAPHTSMIWQMRLVRDDKYRMLLKFVLRFYQREGKITEALPAFLKFGSYLPADRKEAIDMVVAAMNSNKRPMSTETAVRVLMDAGFPMDDAMEEVNRIKEQDYEGAKDLVDAIADINEARKYLGMEPMEGLGLPPGDDPFENE